MGILINDMEMPETCDECNFHRYHSDGEYVCVATPMLYPFNLANSKGIRKDWCPLVEVPAAQKKGHWIDEGTNYCCSECHRGCWINSKYCPWCGAYMRGERNE